MRWIVLLLAIVNLGLLGWHYTSGGGPRDGPSPPAAPGGVAGIALARSAGSGPGAQPLAAALEGEPLCIMLGPIGQAPLGEDIVQRLRALQVEARLQNIDRQGQLHTWVYLPPLQTRRDALRKLRELQAAELDSYVIPQGPLANGISFGIFSAHERARALAQSLRQQGIAVQLRRQPQVYHERWVAAPAASFDHLGADFWRQLQREYPRIERRQQHCRQLRAPETGAGAESAQ